jgi:hypothetical protein
MSVELVQHANVLPWSVDTAFFMQLAAQIARAVALLAFVGLVYAGLYRLLSNRDLIRPKDVHRDVAPVSQDLCAITANDCLEEDVFNEA